MHLDMNLFHSLWTVVVLITFVGIIIWAYSKNQHSDFEEAARLPLEDDLPPTKNIKPPEHRHV